MAFIKVQKLVRNDDGSVRSGSAAIIDVIYDKSSRYHSKQVQREKLGKIVSLAASKRRGVFMSPTRGLIGYDADKDDFFDPKEFDRDEPAVSAEKQLICDPPSKSVAIQSPPPQDAVHKIFGDAYLALESMRMSGLLFHLRKAFPDDHVYEGVLVRSVMEAAGCSGMSPKSFLGRSFLSDLFSGTDFGGKFLSKAGSEGVRSKFGDEFRFGKVPFFVDASAYGGPNVMIEFDGPMGGPVGCEAILDPAGWADGAPSLGVAVLGEEYMSEKLFKRFGPESAMTFIVKMPAKKGYPYKDLCQKALKHVEDKECIFEIGGREFFAVKKKVELFGRKASAYICSETGGYGIPSPEFTVLVSNKGGSPEVVAEAYMNGLRAEAPFRHEGMGYSAEPREVCGEIMCQIAASIVRKAVSSRMSEAGYELAEAMGIAQSLMSSTAERIWVEPSGEDVDVLYASVGVGVPRELVPKAYKKGLMKPSE
ncbi:MAG: hypothetical protein IKP20_05785 [Candidatus Methanomethylophilaceae archaeon]|nr:hypothetical protein [Candidatus Methanomethylophilaceae archaeon]